MGPPIKAVATPPPEKEVPADANASAEEKAPEPKKEPPKAPAVSLPAPAVSEPTPRPAINRHSIVILALVVSLALVVGMLITMLFRPAPLPYLRLVPNDFRDVDSPFSTQTRRLDQHDRDIRELQRGRKP